MDDAAAARKSDAKKASREAGVYAYSRVAASLLILVLMVVGARVYSKPELAYVTMILLLYESAMAIGSLGLADAVFYFIGRDPGGARMVVRQTSFLLLSVAIPVIAVTMVAGVIISDAELDLRPVLPWIAVVLLLELPTQPAVNQLIATGHARLASGLFVGLAVMRTGALLAPGIFGFDVEHVAKIMVGVGLCRLAVHLIVVKKFFPLEPGERRGHWAVKKRLKEILWFALPAGAALIAGKLNPQIDKYAVQLMLGVNDLAEYSVAAFELPLITLVPYAVAAVMQARYVRFYMAGDIASLRELWFASIRKTALIVVPLATMCIALGEEMVTVIAGHEYARAGLPFQIFTIVVLHRIAAYSSILQSVNQTRAVMVSSLLLVLTNLALAYPLTKLFGYPGPAISSVVAVAPAWAYVLWRIGAVLGGGIRGALPWRFYLQVLAVGAVCALATWLVVDQLPYRAGARLGIGAALYVTLFIVAGRLLRFIHADDLEYLGQWLTLRMLKK
jgi:O-antigen/teichoic acid export membrane protein